LTPETGSGAVISRWSILYIDNYGNSDSTAPNDSDDVKAKGIKVKLSL
jgi:hypothetical protein